MSEPSDEIDTIALTAGAPGDATAEVADIRRLLELLGVVVPGISAGAILIDWSRA